MAIGVRSIRIWERVIQRHGRQKLKCLHNLHLILIRDRKLFKTQERFGLDKHLFASILHTVVGWVPTETSWWLLSVADSSWTLGARTSSLQCLGKCHLFPCLRWKTGSNYKTKGFIHFPESVFRDIWNSSNKHTKETIRSQQLLTNYMHRWLNSSISKSCRVHTVKLTWKGIA